MGTQLSGSQINRRWALAGGLGLIITGGATIGAIFVARNGAGVETHKVHSDGSVTQSGSMLAKSGSTTTFFWNTTTARVGVRTQTPKTEFDVVGTVSGSALYISRAFSGAGLADCDTGASSKLLWDASTGRFSCGTDQNSASAYTAGQGLSLNGNAFLLNSTITGSLVRHLTVSGSFVYAKSTLSTSGSLVVEGAMSGAALFVGTSFRGAGLVSDCDTGGTSKLLWDATTGRFSCGTDTDTNTTYTAGQGLTLAGTSFRVNAAHSGTVIWATTTLRSSGSLVVEGTTSGSTIIGGTVSGSMLRFKDLGSRRIQMEIFASGSTIATKSGAMMFTVADPTMSGSYLKSAHFSVQTAGTTNTTTLQIRNAGKNNCKMFSTPISIDSAENGSDTAATPYVINSSCRDIGAYHRLIIDIPGVSTTVPKGSIQLYLEFHKP